MFTRPLLAASTVFALGAAAFGGKSMASAATESHAQVHSPLLKPVKLDRRNAQLRLVQVVFRHGARTPLTDESYLWGDHEWNVAGKAYEPVPMKLLDVNGGPAPENGHDLKQRTAKLPGGAHKGELTIVGQLQALELGYWLRQQYIDAHGFLPASYKSGLLSARTTNFSRTKATMAGVLTGLYPGTEAAIPVITSGDLDEILYADTKRCPHLKVLMKASEAMLKAHWESPAQAPQINTLQQQLSKIFNLPEGAWERRWMVTDIHDVIVSMAAHGKELPAGLTKEMRDEIDRLATEEISAFICPALVDDHGHAVLRLSMGRLLDVLLANMDAAHRHIVTVPSSVHGQQQQQQQPRLMLYSGHDSTVMPLLTALGAEVGRWPPYISNLAFELWELQPAAVQPSTSMGAGSSTSHTSSSSSPGKFVVRVLYNKQPLELPGASEVNPHLLELQDFRDQVLAPFILSQAQHDEACLATISHDQALPQPDSQAPQDQSEDWNLAGGSSAAGGKSAANASGNAGSSSGSSSPSSGSKQTPAKL